LFHGQLYDSACGLVFSCLTTFSVAEIAKERGVSMAQIGLAWILSKDVVSAPIVGTTSLDKLADLVGEWIVYDSRPISLIRMGIAAVNLKLTEEEIKSIEEHYKPQKISGHW
jgi:diketogulonate reductase-like aldo/keto reductase